MPHFNLEKISILYKYMQGKQYIQRCTIKLQNEYYMIENIIIYLVSGGLNATK